MDNVLAALGHPTRLAVVDHLLGLGYQARLPRPATHAELREALGILPGTLTKALQKLDDARLVVASPGPRQDQPVYAIRQPGKVLALLATAAELDAALTRDSAALLNAEVELTADRAGRYDSALGAASVESRKLIDDA
jgi:DNA-binding transcriptional ArsR family regulator